MKPSCQRPTLLLTTFAWVVALLFLRHAASRAEDTPRPSDSASPALRCVVGLSPFLERDAKNEVYRHLVQLLLEGLPRNSSLAIFDAYHLRSVARFDLPNLPAFDSAKTRAAQFREPVGALKRFLTSNPAPPHGRGFEGTPALRLPQFLDFVAENLLAPDHATRVVVLGSPLYLDEKEPSFSMADGYFPSDGHLLASRDRSLYGVADRGRQLAGVPVWFGALGDPWVSDLHRHQVTRFWRLFIERQGGRLAGFGGDLPVLFTDLARPQPTTTSPEPSAEAEPDLALTSDPASSKLEMRRVTREVANLAWITGDRSESGPVVPPTTRVGPLKIGIRWKGNLDLDLYARPDPRAERLYFEHPSSAEGTYYKDHRSSPDREYEFIEFTRPVDVRSLEAAINFYQGESPGGIEGEVRVEFEGRIYSGRFRIEADSGNRGREGSRQSRWWTRVDLPRLLGLGDLARITDPPVPR